MFIRARTSLTIVVIALIATYPQLSRAETFTSREFLTWKSESRVSYFRSSIGMAGVIASQINKTKSRCIDAFYAREDKAGYPTFLKAARAHSEYHPQAIILWVIQNECGKLNTDE